MSCKCYYCQIHKQINKAKREKDVETLHKLAVELGGRAISAEDDADYHSCILDGSWPTSVEILKNALQKAQERKE